MAKEKNLTTVTSVAAADFLRVVTSAGASVKATLSTLKESIGVNALENRFRYVSSGSFNDIIASGLYYCQSVADPPSSNFTSWTLIVIAGSTTAMKQIAYPLANNELVFIRYRDVNGWKAWVTMPTRAEMNTLNNYYTKEVSVSTSGMTFNMPNNYRGTLFIHDSTPDRCGVYMVYTTSGGVAGTKAISTANDITMNNSTNNKLTITPTSGSRVVMFLNAQGTVTV